MKKALASASAFFVVRTGLAAGAANLGRTLRVLLSESTKLKTLPKGRVFSLVRPGGLEPSTFWFVARHSIQLSYERIYTFSEEKDWRRARDSNPRYRF